MKKLVLNSSQTSMTLFTKLSKKTKVYCMSGEGNGTPLQYSCLENPMDREAWWATVHRVAKSRTRLSDFTFTFLFHALEKEMATHSSALAWRIPGTGEPGGLPSMGSHRVGHDWSDLAAAAAYCMREDLWVVSKWENIWETNLYVEMFEFRELVMDRETWRAVVRGVVKSWTWLSNWIQLVCGNVWT